MQTADILNIAINPALKDSFSVEVFDGQLFGDTQQRRISFNELILVQQGHGALTIDDVTYNITPQSLFIISKGQIYAASNNNHIQGYILRFGDCFWEKAPSSAANCKAVLYNDPAGHQQIQLNTSDATAITGLMKNITEDFNSPDYSNKADALAAYLKIIMIKVANINSLLNKSQSSADTNIYRQYVELVSKEFRNTHEVNEYAEKLGISYRQLADLCKRCGGRRAKDIINGQLVAEAKRLLQFSSKPVRNIL